MTATAAARASLRVPGFIAELDARSFRPRLYFGIGSGYALALGFGALALLASAVGMIAHPSALLVAVAAKLATNTLAWACLRRDRWVLPTSGVNVAMDVVVITAAIHLTGGLHSPLFGLYLIEIAVIALLTNLGTTAVIGGGAWLAYLSVIVGEQLGMLPAHPSPLALRGIDAWTTSVYLALAAGMLGGASFYGARVLQLITRQQQELTRRSAAAIDAVRAKSEFMANLTHELRTPIQGIYGLVDLLDHGIYGPLQPAQREAVDGIRRCATTQLRLVDDLLTLARAEAGRLPYTPELVDPRELLEATVALARWMAGLKPVEIALEVPESLPALWIDRGKLVHVVMNLLANALKFSPDGGVVYVRAGAERPLPGGAVEIWIAVEDCGPGIPVHQLAAIFEPFHQVDGSSRRAWGGAGLGLALVRRLLEAMAGRIEVVSAPGRGSSFRVRLPVTPAPTCAPDAER